MKFSILIAIKKWPKLIGHFFPFLDPVNDLKNSPYYNAALNISTTVAYPYPLYPPVSSPLPPIGNSAASSFVKSFNIDAASVNVFPSL